MVLCLQVTSDNPKPENSAQPPTTTDVNNAISKPQKANYAREHSDIEHDTQKHPVQGGLPPNIEISKREPAPFVPPPAPFSISKEGHPVESPKNDIKSVSPSESAPSHSSQSSQQRREKAVVAPQGNPSVFNMNDFMPVRAVLFLLQRNYGKFVGYIPTCFQREFDTLFN